MAFTLWMGGNFIAAPNKGDLVWARDRVGDWYEARVEQLSELHTKIHFFGWSAAHDEWKNNAEADKWLRYEEPDSDTEFDRGEYEVDKLLKKRKRGGIIGYDVRWLGFDETWDTWEPATNIHPECIAEYEARQPRGAHSTPARAFVLDAEDPVSSEAANELAQEWYDKIGRQMVALLKRQQLEWAGKPNLEYDSLSTLALQGPAP